MGQEFDDPGHCGTSTATSKTIAQQVADGIRCLDIRLYYHSQDQQVYTYHGLIGSRITGDGGILDDIRSFLSSTSGEIVYITMGHCTGFSNTDSTYQSFLQQVTEKLGNFTFKHRGGNPFETKYEDILSQNRIETETSRVILVLDTETVPSENFWPVTYSPPNAPNDGITGWNIAGVYSNSSDANTTIAQQLGVFAEAKARSLPFALYMTLTPSTSESIWIIVADLSSAIAKLGVAMLSVGQLEIYGLLEGVAVALELYKLSLSWTTLYQLSQQIDQYSQPPMNPGLVSLLTTRFQAADAPENQISIIYSDYYETTAIVDLAIHYSTLVPLAKGYGDPVQNCNTLISTGSCQFCDLHGQDLSGRPLNGANLQYANLEGANLTWTDFRPSNLPGYARGPADLKHARLHGANLTATRLDDAHMSARRPPGCHDDRDRPVRDVSP